MFKDYICEVKITQYLIVLGVNAKDAEDNVKRYLEDDWNEPIEYEYEPNVRIVCRPYNPKEVSP